MMITLTRCKGFKPNIINIININIINIKIRRTNMKTSKFFTISDKILTIIFKIIKLTLWSITTIISRICYSLISYLDELKNKMFNDDKI